MVCRSREEKSLDKGVKVLSNRNSGKAGSDPRAFLLKSFSPRSHFLTDQCKVHLLRGRSVREIVSQPDSQGLPEDEYELER